MFESFGFILIILLNVTYGDYYLRDYNYAQYGAGYYNNEGLENGDYESGVHLQQTVGGEHPAESVALQKTYASSSNESSIEEIRKKVNKGVFIITETSRHFGAFKGKGIRGTILASVDVGISLASFIPMAAPFVGAFGTILNLFTEDKIIPAELQENLDNSFRELNEKLDRIEAKLDKIFDFLKNQTFGRHYDEVVVHLSPALSHYLKNPKSQYAREQFLTFCNMEPTVRLMNSIDSEVVGKKLFVRNNLEPYRISSRRKLISNYKFVTDVMTTALLLHSSCFSARFTGKLSAEEVMDRFTPEADRFKAVSRRVEEVFKSEDRELGIGFFAFAREDAEKFAANPNNSKISHGDFATQLYNLIKEKYYWCDWVAGSYFFRVALVDVPRNERYYHYSEGGLNKKFIHVQEFIALLGKDKRSWFLATPDYTPPHPIEPWCYGAFERGYGCAGNIEKMRSDERCPSYTIICFHERNEGPRGYIRAENSDYLKEWKRSEFNFVLLS